jgi:hypothetical protein
MDKPTAYLLHVEVRPSEWRAIWNATAPQAKKERNKPCR